MISGWFRSCYGILRICAHEFAGHREEAGLLVYPVRILTQNKLLTVFALQYVERLVKPCNITLGKLHNDPDDEEHRYLSLRFV